MLGIEIGLVEGGVGTVALIYLNSRFGAGGLKTMPGGDSPAFVENLLPEII